MTRDELLLEIKHHPERQRHSFDDMIACCFISNAVDLEVWQAHETNSPIGFNGRRYDIISGPRSYGATH